MRAKANEKWGDVLLLERGFVTCLTVHRDVVTLQSSDETIQEKIGRRECALDTLLLGHGFGVSASASTAALAKKMAAFQASLSSGTHSPQVPHFQVKRSLSTNRDGGPSCVREYANTLGVYRAMGDGCILVRFHNRIVVRYDVEVGVLRIISSEGDELSSTIEHPFPLTRYELFIRIAFPRHRVFTHKSAMISREQVSSIEWFATWGFKSDDQVQALHQKLQAMSAMVHTAVQRSSLFLSFLDKKHDGQYLPSPVSVAFASPLSYPPSRPTQQQIAFIPTGKDLTDLASRMLEQNRNYLENSHSSLPDGQHNR